MYEIDSKQQKTLRRIYDTGIGELKAAYQQTLDTVVSVGRHIGKTIDDTLGSSPEYQLAGAGINSNYSGNPSNTALDYVWFAKRSKNGSNRKKNGKNGNGKNQSLKNLTVEKLKELEGLESNPRKRKQMRGMIANQIASKAFRKSP